MKYFIKYFVLISLAVVSFSCDAPRLNPLDPYNPESKLGRLEGYVLSSTRVPIAGAKVIWKNQNLLTFTDSTGYYLIEDVFRNDGIIQFEKEGFRKDSLSLRWNNQRNIRLEEKLLEYTIGRVDGFVIDILRNPIPGVKVIWKNQNLITVTNIQGFYQFEGLQINSGMIYFEKEGLINDSIYINWNTNQLSVRAPEKTMIYNVANLKGSVRTESIPRVPISNVKVFWKNNNMLVETNSLGIYSFNNLPQSNGWLFFEKDGYAPDSVYVTFDGRNTVELGERNLNANPDMKELLVYTIVQNRHSGLPIIRLIIQTSLTDAEGDIDSVFVNCKPLNFSKLLEYNPANRYYEGKYLSAELNLISLDEAIGQNFEIKVKDRFNRIFNVGGTNIKRIIRQEVIPESPINKSVVGSKPILRWSRFQPGYNFYYHIQIFTDEVSPILIWQKNNISKEDIEIVADINIPPGEYYWLISSIDDFGNTGISKPATFVVQ